MFKSLNILSFPYELNYDYFYWFMISDNFFHPDHIVPAVEFITAVMALANLSIAKTAMKLLAVPGQIFILDCRVSNTGIQVQNAPLFNAASSAS